jgi:hypothetical protein
MRKNPNKQPPLGPNVWGLVLQRLRKIAPVRFGREIDRMEEARGKTRCTTELLPYLKEAAEWAGMSVKACMLSPGNPHGRDEEAIAGDILSAVGGMKSMGREAYIRRN